MIQTADVVKTALAGGSRPIAYTGEGVLNADDLHRQVLAWYQFLNDKPQQSVGIWLASSWDFLCAFIGLALSGKRIVMPHNLQEGAALQMSDYFQALITDRPATSLSCPQWQPDQALLSDARVKRVEPTAAELAASAETSLVLFTSGSTGEPTPVFKTLADLNLELAELSAAFLSLVADRPVLTTVSHQHIYGLLHFLLWPLERGAPFVTEACHYPEVLAEQAKRHGPVVLVSSPTHLSRLPQAQDFCAEAACITEVFSSGGLLDGDSAAELHKIMQRSPVEILGSTETGGIAWRRQSDTLLWQPLPEVCVAASDAGLLTVTSRHLGGLGEFTMGDKITLEADGRFALLGRADTVVKVEGKRLSLTEMEARLAEHTWVRECRVAVVRGRRDEVGVVAVLTNEANKLLQEEGKRWMNIRLREHLQSYFEAPLLPRRWRFVSELPRNTQGKILAADILSRLQEKES